ncbi:MAG: glycosyltransferase family 2 protein [Gammaproteobacteria bacterium]|nr:glycosyltransferase family 2 protein [Gammaproteobacteria bacterium]
MSVILPTYNRAGLLPRSIASVLKQSFEDLELIVVDDGSEDETQAVVRAIQDRDPRVIYHRRGGNGGVSAARNTGLRLARGAYLAFQDSDDEWLPEKLGLQMEGLRTRGPETFSVGVVLRWLGGMVRYWPPAVEAAHAHATGVPRWLLDEFAAYVQALVVPRTLVDAVGGFDETLPMWEDWDLMIKLVQIAQPVRCANALVASTRQEDSLTSNRPAFADIQGRIIDRHRSVLERDPRFLARLQYIVGRHALEQGEAAEATARFIRSIRCNPWDPKAWVFAMLACSEYLTGAAAACARGPERRHDGGTPR